MSTKIGEWLQMVDDCETRESRLNDWERGFIASMRSWLEGGSPLYEKQEETLTRIWDKATEKG